MLDITLYSLHTPKCEILFEKLLKLGANLTVCDAEDTVIPLGEVEGILEVPFIALIDTEELIDDNYKTTFIDYEQAIEWLNKLEEYST